ncbi:hypothetical protein H072_6713 [Dactylellina haptotyla CBS 200.50]|uniref:Carboxylic ester hydrolase n=1 Tax=Dactylellina haptotyla (strain CBS 200.50) TaxID=1284197 RepID=S8AEF3_DACHA|nr:hypothetical protein H072_6713 [Dactylellina haptotyla CBS 200.50]
MKFTDIFAAYSLLSVSYATSIPTGFQQRCSELSKSFRPDDRTTILLSEFVSAGSNVTNPDNHPTCQKKPFVTTLADMCRLRLNVKTSGSSDIIMEAWMPVNWNDKSKRFLVIGNGGLGGCVSYGDLAFTAYLGFAAIAHNNGHTGDTGIYFLNQPEVLKDFVYRAVQTATNVGKQAVTHFYKKSLNKSYYLGCSTGGRQGLKAAQEFPEEFDGIVAGAPANDNTNLDSMAGYYYKALGKPGDATFVTAEQWAAINEMVLGQCDGLDGVRDRVIEDPMMCNPRPEAMFCAPGQTWASNRCLTSAQVGAVRKVYQAFYGKDGNMVYPRLNPGAEIMAAAYMLLQPARYLIEWFKYAIFNNEQWSVDRDFNLDAVAYASKLDPYGISTWKDLSKLKATGHKLLVYHGLMDGIISSENSYRYYEHVSRSMGLPSDKLDEFYRFFPIPGHGHCLGGNGAWFIGAAVQFSTKGVTEIPTEGGVLMSMVKWVEEGVAPERIVGRNITSDGVFGVKEHCKWPKRNVYLGGDASKKESWGCQ